MLGQRRRRWANIQPPPGQRLVFSGPDILTGVGVVWVNSFAPCGVCLVVFHSVPGSHNLKPTGLPL